MAAEVQIRRWTGSSGTPTKTNITSSSTRLSASDNPNPGTSYPVIIPGYTYWAAFRLYANTAPTGTINNLKWYTDGTNSFGGNITLVGNTATSYVQATGTESETGDVLNTTNYSTLAGAPGNMFNYTNASPLSVTGSTTGTGDFGDFVVLQSQISSGATPGTSPSETITWKYDET